MNILLLVIDSLRASALAGALGAARAPFLHWLSGQSVCFRQAFATECWTLPSHVSMFTGLLPSEHGAHFQTMGYDGPSPTIAEILCDAGYETELVTRNFVFDGTIRGVTRGFQTRTAPLASTGAQNPFGLALALAKPRVRRHLRDTGFFHRGHRDDAAFVARFARTLVPADAQALDHLLERTASRRRARRPSFRFCNLYDVHAPYPPAPDSFLRPFDSVASWRENLSLPYVLSRLGAHRYLQRGFRISAYARGMLEARYHRAIELMDAKLAAFYRAAQESGLLEDTIMILTSDHGEAFGEHGLFLHDASVYDTHLHVPLWIHVPGRAPEMVDDVVSTRDLFGLMRAVGLRLPLSETILDHNYRARHAVALAEHYHYPHVADALPKYRQNLAAAISRRVKVIVGRNCVAHFDRADDPAERRPLAAPLAAFPAHSGAEDAAGRAAIARAMEYLSHWHQEAPR